MDYACEVEVPMHFVTKIMQKFGNTSPDAKRMHENKFYTSSSAPAASALALVSIETNAS